MERGGRVELIGDSDLTDYHSPRGDDLTGATAWLASQVGSGTPFSFDSLPERAAETLRAALISLGIEASVEQHEIAAVVTLPASFDEYLMVIGKKERHETRRKRRRFAEECGEPSIARIRGDEAVAAFAAMHRTASGDKGVFMTDEMEVFFAALHRRVGAVIDVLVGGDGEPVAASFGFEDDNAFYLYNSAYDPAAAHASPGVVLVSMLIENTISSGRQVFDFLKGDETYKFRLGAAERRLYALTGVFGGTP